MNRRTRLIVSGTLILVVLTILALAVGFALAKEPGPGGEINEVSRAEAEAATETVYNVIPIQGHLTDDTGNPIDGNHVITFSIYASSSATTPLCQDDDLVDVDNGLFTAEMDWCTSSDIDGKRLYLGIQVEGDEEMTPRESIYPVPYAFSLRPGAIISGSTSMAIVHVENWHESARGLRAYAMSETGVNYGVVGASRSPDGYGGYYYNNEGGVGLYSEANNSTIGGIGVEAVSEIGSGLYGHSAEGFGVYGLTNAGSNNYGLYTPDNLYSLNYHSMGAIMQIVQNGGEEPLEPGDVVAFSGIGAPVEENGPPTIQVIKATAADSTAVAGVVSSRFNIKAANALANKVNPANGPEITPAGSVSPGEYMLMVVQGPAQVKVSARAGSLQPGTLLSSAGRAGYAGRAPKVSIGDIEAAMPGTVLGKALEALDEGEGLIYVFVTLK